MSFSFKILALLCVFSQFLFSQSKEIQFLTGKDAEHTKEWDFWINSGRKSGSWSKINVPSHWEQQGFGSYNYGRDYVTYGKNFKFYDETGLYKHKFTVPNSWKGKTVNIVFEGSMTDTEVKINGKSAGAIHQGAFYEFKYDISEKIQFGKENILEVKVSKMSTDKSINNAERLADYWILGGIFRPVYLEANPKEHILSTAIEAKADGTFRSNISLKGINSTNNLKVEIFDVKNKLVGESQVQIQKGDTLKQIQFSVKNPKLWTAETPNLYKAKFTLNKNKKTISQIEEKFGFRTIEIRKGDGIFINGTKVKMKGINRHLWWPETGRAVTENIDLMDVQLIKEMHMNAVRCSHYPPNKSFLKICDSLGLYVLDELAGWQKKYSTEVGKKLVKEMVIRDANNPSIIFWSNGNEGGHNFDLDAEFAKYDLSNRPVIHAHHKPGNAFNGIDCNHYEDYYSTKKILEGENIYMSTEFLHAQDDGGGGTSLADYWELHWNSKKGAGGFLWAFVDEGLVRTDFNNQIDVNAINAPDGVLGPHREKEGSFYAIREIYSPVKIDLKSLPNDFNGNIPVENRYHFTNLKNCQFEWKLIKFKTPFSSESGFDIIKTGKAESPNIKPTEKRIINLNLPANWKENEGLLLTATDSFGKEIYTWTWKIKSNDEISKQFSKSLTKEFPVSVYEDRSVIILKSDEKEFTFDRADGLLKSVTLDKKGKKISLKNGPVFVNDKMELSSIKSFTEEGVLEVEVRYKNGNKIIWKLNPNGILEMNYEYFLSGDYQFSGVSFDYPENYVINAKWLGKGPYHVWKNRLQGQTYNVWQNLKNSSRTGQSPWIYPEFKGYFDDVSWLQLDTAEGKITVGTKEEKMFVRLFDFYGIYGAEGYPKLPSGNISFLDAIPPLGTVLAFNINDKTESLGLESEPNHLNGTFKRTLYFYFGLPDLGDENKQFTMPKENILTD
ncbi:MULTISPECIES: glycoside hydrolase family 2 TIM barrel-domain containing protein [unclassified Chryseobacterium]|uniref:glycoside hydrolase family 2 TIM barrel-domain containing protein n=1 Tax=unclassified Chryseobacterium TaxID=2593645 RepID=UPI002269BCA9|nr:MULTISPECIES: glycoside hydrolase family 2 TIM barrel-domain containing protein [unclassified Chryseobacterium]